ncbi:MAG: MBL fold metallo-hydrolase [Myxococcota bacterium]
MGHGLEVEGERPRRSAGRVLQIVLLAVVGLALAAVFAARWALEVPDLTPWLDRYEIRGQHCSRGADAAPCVEVAWLGVATLLFDDGDTRLLVDGFFSRPGLMDLVAGRAVEPDREAISTGLARMGLNDASVVMTVHSHYDHAMDSPEVARRLGAVLLGSRSTAMVGRGSGLAEERIVEVEVGRPYAYGEFRVTYHASRHVPLPGGQGSIGSELDAPLAPPAAITDYVEGGSYTIEIAHPAGVALVQGSAGFIEGGLEGVRADVVLLGIGGLARQSPEYRDAYYFELLDRVGARRVIPIHWDDFTKPPGVVEPFPVGFGNVEDTLAELEARARGTGRLELQLLPPWQRTRLLGGAP